MCFIPVPIQTCECFHPVSIQTCVSFVSVPIQTCECFVPVPFRLVNVLSLSPSRLVCVCGCFFFPVPIQTCVFCYFCPYLDQCACFVPVIYSDFVTVAVLDVLNVKLFVTQIYCIDGFQ